MVKNAHKIREQIIQLKLEHHDLDMAIARLAADPATDELHISRMRSASSSSRTTSPASRACSSRTWTLDRPAHPFAHLRRHLEPAELVSLAVSRGVTLLALTDHDTVDGLAAAKEAAAGTALRLVNGVEISVSWEHKTLHVVGLDVDTANPALSSGLARLQTVREERAVEMGRRWKRAVSPAPMRAPKPWPMVPGSPAPISPASCIRRVT